MTSMYLAFTNKLSEYAHSKPARYIGIAIVLLLVLFAVLEAAFGTSFVHHGPLADIGTAWG